MNKKIFGICGVAILLIGTMFIMPVTARNCTQGYEAKLHAIGFIRIDTQKYEINGFVLFGLIDEEVIIFQKINIVYGGTTILVTNPAPLLFSIQYNPT